MGLKFTKVNIGQKVNHEENIYPEKNKIFKYPESLIFNLNNI